MEHAQLLDAMSILKPGAAYTVEGDQVTMLDGTAAPTVEQIQTALTSVAAEGTRNAIRIEAERRISAGLVLASGVRFRCDDQSIARLTGMTTSTVWPKTFKTQGGVTVTLNNQTQAQAVFAECDTYITAVLAASATLQDNPPSDPTNNTHWPGDGS